MKAFISTFLLLSVVTFANGQKLLRGPYQQKKTHYSINIKWRTDTKTLGKVYYGTDLNNLQWVAIGDSAATDHDVEVKHLQPYTKYFYKIESDGKTLSGSDSMHWFRTAPLPGSVQPIRIWAIGDFGKGNDAQRRVRDSYLEYMKKSGWENDVWLWLGDNVYNDGTDQEYQDKVFEPYYAFSEIFKYMHFYPCPGNHDYGVICPVPCQRDPNTHSGPYYNIITVPTLAEAGGKESYRELYYSFDYGNIHFISLNSELGSPVASYDWIGAYTNGFQNSPLRYWLIKDLQHNKLPWVIAFWHQPPYSKGSHDSDKVWEIYMKAMRQNIVPILEDFGVDLVINGHSHNYERSYLIKGHTGLSSTFNPQLHIINGKSGNEDIGEAYIKYTDGPDKNKGTVYVISGNAGSQASDPPFNEGKPHPAMFYWDGGDGVHGSFVLEVHGNKLTGCYLTAEGIIKDKFSIIKQSTSVGIKESAYPKNLTDVRVVPNPFSKSTTVFFTLADETALTIELLSLDGKRQITLANQRFSPGDHHIHIQASDLHLASGQYIIRIDEGKHASLERIVKID
jgi:hypothetical protein